MQRQIAGRILVTVVSMGDEPLTNEQLTEEILRMEIAYNATGRHRIHLEMLNSSETKTKQIERGM